MAAVSDLSRAEWALHRRMRLACVAAVDAGLVGRFRVWDQAGLLAVLASDPALAFLSAVSGVTRETVPAVIEFVGAPTWGGVQPTVVVSSYVDEALLGAGMVRVGDRGLAIRRLGESPVGQRTSLAVVEVGADSVDFVRILLAGYEVDGSVAAFIGAEHRHPDVRRFLAVKQGTPIAAAAMTIQDGVAVLGGASTLRAHRRDGAQSRLLQHRLQAAAQARCGLAVATVLPDSVSAANLRRAGFGIHRRSAWRKP